MAEGTLKISEVSRRTGLPPATIRAWERRYGLLTPDRTGGGQRLYSDDDVRALLAVNDLVRSGWALAAAAEHVSSGVVAEASPSRVSPSRVSPGRASKAQPSSGTASGGAPRSVERRPRPGRDGATERPTASVAVDVDERADRRVDGGMDTVGLMAAHDAARAMLRASSPVEVVAALVEFVVSLGGTVGPAALHADDVFPVDVSLGEGDPLLPRAEVFSIARLRLEALLPALVEDARGLVALLHAARR